MSSETDLLNTRNAAAIKLLVEIKELIVRIQDAIVDDEDKDSNADSITLRLAILSLIRQMLYHIDGVVLLLNNGCEITSRLQFRSILEAGIFIEWILHQEKSSYRKAKFFMVSDLRNLRRTFEKETEDVCEESRLRFISDIDQNLSNEHLTPVNKEFGDKRKSYDKPWYKVYGKKSIKEIFTEVDKDIQYAIFYSLSSQTVHPNRMSTSLYDFKLRAIRSNDITGMSKSVGAVAVQTIAVLMGKYPLACQKANYQIRMKAIGDIFESIK